MNSKQKNNLLAMAVVLLTATFLAFSLGYFLGERGRGAVLSVPQPEEEGEEAQMALLVDLNTATAEELTALPGIGEKLAAEIVAFRKQEGRFSSLEELELVSGIGPATVEKLRPFVTLS